MTKLFVDHLRRISAHALSEGGQRSGIITTDWRVSGRCQAPVSIELYARPSPTYGRGKVRRTVDIIPGVTETPQRVLIEAPCRKCPPCLAERARLWRGRARAEIAFAQRTWFGTITLKPEERYRVVAEARALARHQRVPDFDTLAEGEKFARLHRQVGPLLTKWLKRVREESKATIRFLLVAEAHKDGFPHYHVLIHEVSGSQPLVKEVLRAQWLHGFTRWKLVDDGSKASFYVTKYLTKSALARVRASLRYGEGPLRDRVFEKNT